MHTDVPHRPSLPLLTLVVAIAGSVLGCNVDNNSTLDAGYVDACVAGGDTPCDDAGGTGGTVGTDAAVGGTPVVGAPIIIIRWDGDVIAHANDTNTLTVAIDDGDETHAYRLGMAQTGAANGWDGEDCLPGALDGKDVCHEVGEDGALISSVSSAAGVDNDHTLLFRASDEANEITYVVIQTDTGHCWSFGNDPTWYTESTLHCEAYTSP